MHNDSDIPAPPSDTAPPPATTGNASTAVRDDARGFAAERAALAGVVAIPVTPFTADGRVDWPAHAALLARLADEGVAAVTPNGNTGEFYALDPAEARLATENTVKAVGDRTSVIAGIGLDPASAADAARHARDAGAPMVMVHQPVNPYMSGEGWIDYHRAIADAVPDVGVVLYLRDPRITGAHVARLGAVSPNVIGVKYAVGDPVRFASVGQDAGRARFVWVAGLAELSAPGYFAVGATGFTSGLVNVLPRASIDMFRALAAGDRRAVLEIWDLLRPFEELRAADASADNVSVVKEALAQLGLCGRGVRPTSRLLPDDVRAQIAQILDSWRGRWEL